MKVYKYEFGRNGKTLSIGDVVYIKGKDIMVSQILKVDIEEVIVYFHGVEVEQLGEITIHDDDAF